MSFGTRSACDDGPHRRVLCDDLSARSLPVMSTDAKSATSSIACYSVPPASRAGDPDLHVAQGDLLVSDGHRRPDLRGGDVDDPRPDPRSDQAAEGGRQLQALAHAQRDPAAMSPPLPGQGRSVPDAAESAGDALPGHVRVQPAGHGPRLPAVLAGRRDPGDPLRLVLHPLARRVFPARLAEADPRDLQRHLRRRQQGLLPDGLRDLDDRLRESSTSPAGWTTGKSCPTRSCTITGRSPTSSAIRR